MSLLYFLAEHRNAVFDFLNTCFRMLGEEATAIVIVCVLYWCVDRRFAVRIGYAFIYSGIIAQGLKVVFRIPRPWVKDPGFIPRESALNTATGYSFPSGHTQTGAAVYGTIAYESRRKWLKIVCAAAFVLVGFSRMYEGVHTPWDVSVGMIIGLVCVLGCEKYLYRRVENDEGGIIMWLPCVILAAAAVVLTYVLYAGGAVDIGNVEDICKMAGCSVGFGIGHVLQVRFVKFDEQGKMKQLILRAVVGLLVTALLRMLLKIPFAPLGLMGHFLRYMIILFWIMVVYPILFVKIEKQLFHDNK